MRDGGGPGASPPPEELDAKRPQRHLARARRRQLSAHWRRWASQLAAAHLLRLVAARRWQDIAVYWPLPGEVDLRPAMLALWRQGRRLYLPRQTAAPVALHFVAWRPGARLCRGRRGLWQPQGPAAPAAALQAVVMPGLAFDRSGTRLGQGGGAYDRATAGLRARRVGVAWHDCLLPCADAPSRAGAGAGQGCGPALPRAAHDLSMAWVVTPRAVVACPPYAAPPPDLPPAARQGPTPPGPPAGERAPRGPRRGAGRRG